MGRTLQERSELLLKSFLLLKSCIVLQVVMSLFLFIRWTKEREKMAMVAALLMFRSPSIKEFWSHDGLVK